MTTEELLIQKIAEWYDYDRQSRQCIEEMAELTQAINRFWRKQLRRGELDLSQADPRSKEYQNIVEELADVYITTQQMIYFMNCKEAVSLEVNKKLQRQIKRMEAENESKRR